MTDNMDEFEQDQFDADMGMEGEPRKSSAKGFVETLRSKPLFKLIVIVGVVGVAVAGALGAFSGKPDVQRAQIAPPPEVKGTPGGSASPFYLEQNKIANEQRVDQAMKQQGSALPTPVGQNSDLINLDDLNKKDPLIEFRAETERLKQELRAEQQQNSARLQMMQQQMQQQPIQRTQDDKLAQAMQRQMQQLMESWAPQKMQTVEGVGAKEPSRNASGVGGAQGGEVVPASAPASQQNKAKTLVAAGTVNYGQLLTEANSDIPGPIMVQMLSGPFAGGRAIGTFQTLYENLVLTFNVISYKGRDYPINAIAINPDTTLSGLATEVDHRYFKRLVLPAAAAFMSSFGSTMGSTQTTTTINGDAILVDSAKRGYKDALYEGMGEVGNTISNFFQQEAAQTKTLVRVAAGTPMGMFFLRPVTDQEGPGVSTGYMNAQGDESSAALQKLLAQGYQQGMVPTTSMPQAYGTMGMQPNPYGTYGTTGAYPQAVTGNGQVIDLSTLTGGRPGGSTKIYYSR